MQEQHVLKQKVTNLEEEALELQASEQALKAELRSMKNERILITQVRTRLDV